MDTENQNQSVSQMNFHQVYEKYGQYELKFKCFNSRDMTLRYGYVGYDGTMIEAVLGGSPSALLEIGETCLDSVLYLNVRLKDIYPEIIIINKDWYHRND